MTPNTYATIPTIILSSSANSDERGANDSISLQRMITEQRLLEILAECLETEVGAVSASSTREGTEGWDSVAHLSLLGMLDDEVPGILDRYPSLAEAASIGDILFLVNGLG